VEKALYEKGFGTFILDGDNVRAGLNKDLDFSDASRKENIRRIGEVAKLMTDAGVITISAFISPFEAERKTIKELIGSENFIEVYVNCPLSVCEERDVKGLYKKARAGEISNFTGISSPFEAPSHPAIEIPSAELSIEEGVRQIMEVLESRLSL
jgi:adenylylsulfate kinase